MAGSGRSIALIANDQGEALVDTQYGKGNGFEIEHILENIERPDVKAPDDEKIGMDGEYLTFPRMCHY